MKKLCFLLCLIGAGALAAGPLPLSEQGQEEADFYLTFIKAALQSTQTSEICPVYEQLLEKDANNKYLRRQLLLCALDKKDVKTADQYADFIEQGENDGEDYSVYAVYLWRKGDLPQAQQYYEKALELSPDDTRILYQYLVLLSVLDVDQAAQKLQERKAQYPMQAAMLDYETGNLYSKHRKWSQALEYYQSAKKENPQYAEAYLAIADIYEKSNQIFLMLHELEEVEKIGYKNPTVYTRMGAVYVLVKDHARAKEYFLKAKALAPSDPTAGYFLALYAEQEKDFARAAQYLRETSDYPKNASKWLQVSFYQQQAGDEQAALQTLKEAYKRFEDNVEIGYFYGLLLHDQGDFRSAARVLKKLLETNSSYENARLIYAFCLEALGKYKDMEAQVRIILEQNPRNGAAANLLGFSLADRNVRLDEAEQLIINALTIQPQDAAFQDSLAWVYYRQGKLAQAQDLLEKLAPAFIKKNPEVAYHLGAVHAAQGHTEKALPYLQQAAKENKAAAKLLKKLSR